MTAARMRTALAPRFRDSVARSADSLADCRVRRRATNVCRFD